MKKYLIWAIGAVALIAVIVGASSLYNKLSEEYKPNGGGVESLLPWGDGEWGTPSTPTEPDAPSEAESEPVEPSQSETEPMEPPQSETEPIEPSETEPAESAPIESESQTPSPETTKPSQSETEPPIESSEDESDAPAPTETEPETPTPTEPEAETPKEDPPSLPTLKGPDFSVLDLEGNLVKLSEYTDKPIVINFWATWCVYCDKEMPDFERMYRKYGDKVHFLMVNAGNESVSTITNYISKNGYTFPVFYDVFDQAAAAYGISSFPTTYFFFGNGVPGYRGIGMLDGETLEETILSVLG